MLVFALIIALSHVQPGSPRPGQLAQMPPASMWDGVAGFEEVVTDPETGQITYPLGQQPQDALSRGCIFGLSNVRCPKAVDPEALRGPPATQGSQAAGTGGGMEGDVHPDRTAASDPTARIDCAVGDDDTRPGQRLCTFDEALHNSYLDHDAQPQIGGGSSGAGDDESPGAPADRNSCRRIEYRYPGGSGGGVRWECTHTTGSGPADDAVREALRPSPR